MKKTIYKYIFYEFVRYFTITLFALAAIVWAVQTVNFLDLVTEDGHAFTVYFLNSLLTLSKIFTKLIPFSYLIASVLMILKLDKDNNEILFNIGCAYAFLKEYKKSEGYYKQSYAINPNNNILDKLNIFNEIFEVIINIYNNIHKDKYLLTRKNIKIIYDNIKNLIIKYNGFQ